MNEQMLKKEIKVFIHKYLDIPNYQKEIMATYVLRTWKPIGDSVPYLQFVGAKGTGKSRALQIMSMLCKNALRADAAVSPKALCMLIDKSFPCTLILEEEDIKERGEVKTILDVGKMLNSARVVRMEETDKSMFSPVTYNVFCFKVLACRSEFREPGLQANCIKVKLVHRPIRNDVPRILDTTFEQNAGVLWNAIREEMML